MKNSLDPKLQIDYIVSFIKILEVITKKRVKILFFKNCKMLNPASSSQTASYETAKTSISTEDLNKGHPVQVFFFFKFIFKKPNRID